MSIDFQHGGKKDGNRMSRVDRSAEHAAQISNEGLSAENTKIRNQRFKMFFAGLTFAILSFMGTQPIKTTEISLKIFETVSSLSLLLSGIFLLTDLAVESGVMTNSFYIRKICLYMHVKRCDYWTLFIIGVGLMVIDRSVLSFMN